MQFKPINSDTCAMHGHPTSNTLEITMEDHTLVDNYT